MSDMHRILGIKDLESILRTGRLRWYGHLERQPNDLRPNAVRRMDVAGKASRGRPRKRWSDCVSADMSLLSKRMHKTESNGGQRSDSLEVTKESNPQDWGHRDVKRAVRE